MGCAVLSGSVVPDFLRLNGLEPTRFLCPWGFSRQEYWSGLPCPPPDFNQYWDFITWPTENSEETTSEFIGLPLEGRLQLHHTNPTYAALPHPPPLYTTQVGMMLPGKGMLAKLLVSTCRSVSKCCCKTVLRLRSWITSTSSFSTAVRMLSTCFCRAAFLSSNSMLDLRSWRSSASRAEDASPPKHR